MTHQHHHLPSELQATDQALDRLARAEAETAPADLVARLVVATRPARQHSAREHRPIPIWTRRPVMALAASVALVATASLTWVAIQQAPAPTDSAEFAADFASDFDLLLTLTADDAWSAEVDMLKAETAAIETSLDNAWTIADLEGAL